MKSALFCLLALLLSFSLPGSGQSLRSVGLKGGLSFSRQQLTLHSGNDTTSGSWQGGAADLSLEWFNLLRHLSLLTDVGFVQKGGSFSLASTGGTAQLRTETGHWDYATLALLLKPRIKLAAVQVYGLAGLRADRLLQAHDVALAAYLGEPRNWIAGYVLGGGLELKLARIGLMAEVQSLHDFTSFSKPAGTNATIVAQEVSYSRATTAKAGLRFYLAK